MAWYEGPGLARLENDRRIVAGFPDLHHQVEPGGEMVLVGELVVRTKSGFPNRVPTRIEFPDAYPSQEPVAFELSGRFPHDLDHHFIDDRPCLWIDIASRWDPNDPDGLDDYLRELLTFYLRQLAMEADPTLSYPGPSLPHGPTAAYVAYLSERLALPASGVRRMRSAIAGHLGRNAPCPCGRKRRYRKCHKFLVQDFRNRMKPERLADFIASL